MSTTLAIANPYLFNFAVSSVGGGFKRLYEYAKWFNAHGGAWFIVHSSCAELAVQFPNNRFFFNRQPRYARLLNDGGYLPAIENEIGRPDLYYSYGIPLYRRFGRVNWFHLSNVLPFASKGIPLSILDRARVRYLGKQIRRGLGHADVISAESRNSLGLFDAEYADRLFLSVNGSDDELAHLRECANSEKDETAVVVGTYRHKAIRDSWNVFEFLRQQSSGLKLIIIGNPQSLPRDVISQSQVFAAGPLRQPEVISYLRRSRYYISTTLIENSYNAASEGIFFADESYISDIGPHRELLDGMLHSRVHIPHVQRPLLRVERASISGANLKTWADVIGDIINRLQTSTDPAGK